MHTDENTKKYDKNIVVNTDINFRNAYQSQTVCLVKQENAHKVCLLSDTVHSSLIRLRVEILSPINMWELFPKIKWQDNLQ